MGESGNQEQAAATPEAQPKGGYYSYFCETLGLLSKGESGVGLFAAVSMQCNFTIGSGFLIIPWAFYEAGLALGVLTTVLLVYGQYTTNMMCLETHARANLLGPVLRERLINGEIENSSAGERVPLGVGTVVNLIEDDEEDDADGINPTWADSGDEPYGIAEQVDLGVLVGVFLGKSQMKFFSFLYSLSFFFTLWIWSALFAMSWATYVPFGDIGYNASYVIYMFIWMCIQGVWGMMSLEEQSELQVIMFLLRVVMFAVVIITVLIPWTMDINSFDLGNENASYSPPSFDQFQIGNWYIVISVLSFGCANVGSVPVVVGALADKKNASLVVFNAALVSFVCYISFGILLSLYFSENIEVPFSTLWSHFTGFSDALGTTPLYAAMIAGFVVIFPSLDVMSSYAMQSQVVCDTTLYLVLGSGGTASLKKDNKTAYYACRLLTSTVPPLCALISDNLGAIAVFTGSLYVIFQYTYPPVISNASKRKMKELDKPTRTEFTVPYADSMNMITVALSIGFNIMLVLSLAIKEIPDELL